MRSQGSLNTLALLAAASLLTGCSVTGVVDDVPKASLEYVDDRGQTRLEELRARAAEHRSRPVDPFFGSSPVVVRGSDGLKTSRLLFETSASVIVSDGSDAAQLRAASIAVFAHAPMLVYTPERRGEILEEISRLQARRVLLVGDVSIASTTAADGDSYSVIKDPGGLDVLGALTAHRFYPQKVDDPSDVVETVTNLDGKFPTLLVASWDTFPVTGEGEVESFPIQTRRDAGNAPVTVASRNAPVASVANAMAYGAKVTFLEDPDPRTSDEALATLAGLAHRPVLALGGSFDSGRDLGDAIAEAERTAGLRKNNKHP